MFLTEVDTESAALIRSVVAVESAHGMSGGHRSGSDLSVDAFKASEEVWLVEVVLPHMVEDVADVPQRNAESALVTNLVDNHLDPTVDILVAVVKEEGVLRVVFNLPYALRLPLRVIKVLRLEVLLVLVLIVWDISSARCLHNGGSLEH